MKSLSKLIYCAIASAMLISCGDSNKEPGGVTANAIIAAVASDFGSSSLSLVEFSETSTTIVDGFLDTDFSDIRVATNGEHFYRIGRFRQDTLTKFSFDAPSLPIWQYSTNNPNVDGETATNPYDVIFASDTKAYVIRYGAGSVLIIDPSVAENDADNFIIGTIDLSQYDPDLVPQMSAAVLDGNRLYVAMQALLPNFNADSQTAYVSVIDTDTDTEVDTGRGGDLAGIPLTVKNPVDIDLYDGSIYVTGQGGYGTGFVPTLTGGIERISTSDFSSEVVLDDGEAGSGPYGQLIALAFVNSDLAIVTGSPSFGSASTFAIDPADFSVADGAFAGVTDQNVQGVSVDTFGRIWVGLGSSEQPTINIYADDASLHETLMINRNPVQIIFNQRTQ